MALLKALLAGVMVLVGAVAANIVSLNGFRLLPFKLVKKHDFTFSSGS